MFNLGLDFLGAAVQKTRATIDTAFDGFSQTLEAEMERFINSIGSNETLNQAFQPHMPPLPEFVSRIGYNPLFDAFLDYGLRPGATFSAKTTIKDNDFADLIQELQKVSDDFAGSDALTKAATYFTAIKDNPDAWPTLLFKGLLEVVEAVALFAVNGTKTVLDALLDAVGKIVSKFKELLNDNWDDIPLVSTIYRKLIGSDLELQPLRLFSLMLAVPATSLYKATSGDGGAPFPDQASLDRFKSTYTLQWLVNRLNGPGDEKDLAAAQVESDPSLSQLMGLCSSVNWFLRALLETAINAMPSSTPIPTLIGITNVSLRGAQSFFTTPWLVDNDAGGFDCTEPKGLRNWIWVSQAVFGPFRGLVCLKAGGKINDSTLAVWGAAHLALVSVMINKQGGHGKPTEQAVAILSCLAPQLLKVLRLDPVVDATEGASLGALALTTLITEAVCGKLTYLTVENVENKADLASAFPQ